MNLHQVEHNHGHIWHRDFVTVNKDTKLQSHDGDRTMFEVITST
jgi:hypothetical protein